MYWLVLKENRRKRNENLGIRRTWFYMQKWWIPIISLPNWVCISRYLNVVLRSKVEEELMDGYKLEAMEVEQIRNARISITGRKEQRVSRNSEVSEQESKVWNELSSTVSTLYGQCQKQQDREDT
jgi:hypothetical protein